MKKILLFISLCFIINCVDAQNEMWIYQSNGSIVKYNTSEIDSIKFIPIQNLDENTINANQLIGEYYGERLISGLGHYWIILSDNGFVDGELSKNSEFFRIDILGPLAEDENDIRIPDGRYVFDLNNNFEEYSILNIGNSDYTYVDENGNAWATAFSDAELNVNGNKLTLTATADNKNYNVVFEGDYTIEYKKLSEYISTLTDDYEIDLSNCTGTVKCFDDYWESGYCNWQIEFIDNEGFGNGTYLVLDFLTDEFTNGITGFDGTFYASGFTEEDPTKPDFSTYTFVPGMRISNEGHMMGSLVMVYANNTVITQAPLRNGEFTITDNGDGTHTIVIDATDDAEPAHKITLNWTGILSR